MTVEIRPNSTDFLDDDVDQIFEEMVGRLKLENVARCVGDLATKGAGIFQNTHLHDLAQQLFDLNPIDYIHDGQEFSVEQWKTKIGGAVVRSTVWIPDQPIDRTKAVLIAGGFGAPEVAYMKVAVDMVNRGYMVGTWSPPRSQSPASLSTYKAGHMVDPLLVQSQAGYATWKGIQERTGAEHVDLVGHSMGFLIAQRIAKRIVETQPPDTVHTLLSDAGAGLDGPGSLGRHFEQMAIIIEEELKAEANNMYDPESRKAFIYHALYYLLRSPIRLAREGAACVLRKDATHTLPPLKEAGIKVGAILPGNDSFFREEDVLAASGSLLDDIVHIEGAKHVDMNTNPQHGNYIADSLARLEIMHDVAA